MKSYLALFSIAIVLVSGCTNTSEKTGTSIDTPMAASNSTSAQSPTAPAKDTSRPGDELMKAMAASMDQMHSVQMSGDFDVDFANMMIAHHQGANDMAQVELSQGKDEKMKAKAQEIITMQKDEQQKLKDFVTSYKPSGMKHGEGELQQSALKMMQKMKSMQMTGDVDKDFATMMSSHHQDGISMSKMELKNGMSDKLKQMTQKSITNQEKDIKEFGSWLANH